MFFQFLLLLIDRGKLEIYPLCGSRKANRVGNFLIFFIMKKNFLITSLLFSSLAFSNGSQNLSANTDGGLNIYSQDISVGPCFPRVEQSGVLGREYEEVTVCTYLLGVLVHTYTYTRRCGFGID